MSAIGADPSQLDALAKEIDNLAGLLDGRRAWLNGWIELDRFWRGRRANEFRHAWEHQYSPQISHAVGYLREAVRELHDNANQQRVASGEQPKDYGGSNFLGKLFGDAVGGIAGAAQQAAHLVEESVEAAARAVDAAWDDAYRDFANLGGSPLFQQAIASLGVVSDVAGMVALIPIPGVQEAAALVALGTGAAVMVGHLAEMANKGRFDAGEFAGDAVGVVGGGLGQLKYVGKLEGVVDAAGDVNILTTKIPSAKELPNVIKSVSSASSSTRVVATAIVGTRTASAVIDSWTTTDKLRADLGHGNVLDAANDSLGYVKAAGDLLGVKGQLVGQGAVTDRDYNSLVTGH